MSNYAIDEIGFLLIIVIVNSRVTPFSMVIDIIVANITQCNRNQSCDVESDILHWVIGDFEV